MFHLQTELSHDIPYFEKTGAHFVLSYPQTYRLLTPGTADSHNLPYCGRRIFAGSPRIQEQETEN